MKKIYLIVIITALAGSIIGSAITGLFLVKDTNDYIKDFYYTEEAVHVSPHSIRGKMDKGASDFVLVDLRSKEEYEKEHVIGAVNIPAYSDKYTSAYGEVDRIVSAFRALPKDKEIVTYCYSMPCMTSRKIGKMLADHGIYVKYLNIGWNEWRYHWALWNHEHEWNTTDVMDYIAAGPEPGIPKIKDSTSPCRLGEFGC